MSSEGETADGEGWSTQETADEESSQEPSYDREVSVVATGEPVDYAFGVGGDSERPRTSNPATVSRGRRRAVPSSGCRTATSSPAR
jgi:hypothetical protein